MDDDPNGSFARLRVSHVPLQSLACFGAWSKERRSRGLPSNKQSQTVIGSALVLKAKSHMKDKSQARNEAERDNPDEVASSDEDGASEVN